MTSSDEVVLGIATDIQVRLLPSLTRAEALPELWERTESGQLKSLSVVLGQEMDRFNKLTAIMRASLSELQKAIKGLIVMSGELELMYTSMLNNQVGLSHTAKTFSISTI